MQNSHPPPEKEIQSRKRPESSLTSQAGISNPSPHRKTLNNRTLPQHTPPLPHTMNRHLILCPYKRTPTLTHTHPPCFGVTSQGGWRRCTHPRCRFGASPPVFSALFSHSVHPQSQYKERTILLCGVCEHLRESHPTVSLLPCVPGQHAHWHLPPLCAAPVLLLCVMFVPPHPHRCVCLCVSMCVSPQCCGHPP